LFLLVLSQMNPVYSMPPLPMQCLRLILTWTFDLQLRLPSVLLPSHIHTEFLYGFLFFPLTCHMLQIFQTFSIWSP
jgi:hypothetical protein